MVAGFPRSSPQSAHDAVAISEKLAHVPTLVHGSMWAALAHQMRRDLPAVLTCSERLVDLGTKHRLPQYCAVGTMLRGWVSAHNGRASEGIKELLGGLERHTSLSKLLGPFFYSDLAEAYLLNGETELALTAINEALRLSEANAERFWQAEMLRLKGDIVRSSAADASDQSDTWYRRALDLSREQGAKSLELRTAVSMARSWQSRGDSEKAHDLVAPVYNWFTEGFDTADLTEANSLLHELRS
jgi:predicted ATPase